MSCYKIIKQSELSNMNLSALIEYLKSLPTKTLKELRYSDVYQPEQSCHGLYFFVSPDHKKLYVGKSSSRCVADRIGANFDSRKSGFLNSLLKKISKIQYGDIESVNLHRTYQTILDWEITVLFVESNITNELTRLLSVVEGMLIFYFQQNDLCINTTNRRANINVNATFGTLL
jgi:hypothetical protein